MLRSWTTKKLLPDGQIKCTVSELEKTLVFDWRLQRLHRQTAGVILIHHNHPVPPFVVRACSQHLYQITLMYRKNLCFCSTPDGPFNSVWDWTRINPFVVMSCTLTKLPLFRSLAYFCGSRNQTQMGLKSCRVHIVDVLKKCLSVFPRELRWGSKPLMVVGENLALLSSSFYNEPVLYSYTCGLHTKSNQPCGLNTKKCWVFKQNIADIKAKHYVRVL